MSMNISCDDEYCIHNNKALETFFKIDFYNKIL